MEQSVDRILTTHAGSLPRPEDLVQMTYNVLDDRPVDQGALDAHVRKAVAEVVRRQQKIGLDVISGPHHKDVALKDIVKLVLKSRSKFIYVEAASPRHEHEWAVWKDVKLPDHKALIVGVIDTKTNTIEHPELIAERLERFAGIVGKERVIAGTDCGFGTFVGHHTCHPEAAWLKLQALVEGAQLASEHLW